jgi:hypothetical protein
MFVDNSSADSVHFFIEGVFIAFLSQSEIEFAQTVVVGVQAYSGGS